MASSRKKRAPRAKRPAAKHSALSHGRPPYIKRLQHDGVVAVWQVDGDYIRRNIDEEFSNFGHHYSFSEIPADEIWLDQEAHPDEQRFFIEHALVERRLMAEGKDYDTARIAADRVEREMRSRAGDLRRAAPAREPVQAERMHTRLWKALENGVHVWFVNGRLVRSVFDIEFTEGGHDCVYEFVPENEVWIDDDLHEDERGFVLFHELHERNLMAKGMDYDRAHDDASRLEQHYRRHPAELHEGLSNEGWD